MIYESTYYNPNYLAHHGIKGMRWGVRKYQNPDGTLTAAGQKRYYNSDGSLTKKGQKWDQKRKRVESARAMVNDKSQLKRERNAAKALQQKTIKIGLAGLATLGVATAGLYAYDKYQKTGSTFVDDLVDRIPINRVSVDRIPINRIHI